MPMSCVYSKEEGTMGIERVGSKTDVIIKLVLVFFISLLSFSIGTFVGKKFSDNQHRLAKMEPTSEHGTEANRAVASQHEEKTGTENLTDEDIAKLAEEFVDNGKVTEHAAAGTEEGSHDEAKKEEATGHGNAPESKNEVATHDNGHGKTVESEKTRAVASTPTSTSTTEKKESSPAAARVAEGKAPSEAPKKEVKEVSKVATQLPKEVVSSTAGKFTVQIASYPAEGEAQKMAEQLKEKGFSAFYLPAQVNGKTWYRVSVGLFATQKEAQDHKSELMEKANVTSAIISKIVQ